MKRKYITPTCICINTMTKESMLLSLSTPLGTTPLVIDEDDGDASEALIKSDFHSNAWDW